jgi:hypothetical protein
MALSSATGPQSVRPGAGKVYRGSRRRIQRIRLRENTPVAFVILALVLLIVIVATMSWLIQHSPAHHH